MPTRSSVIFPSVILAGLACACGSGPAPLAPASQSTAETTPTASETAPVTSSSASTTDGSSVTNPSSGTLPAPESTAPASAIPYEPPLTPEQVRDEEAHLGAEATGPAVGGPKNNRPCEFHESVDSYQRQCTTSRNPDGSLLVSAKGTKLNPDNGFEFTLHGGPHSFVARGTLNAFYKCAGPFVARVATVIDKGVTTYELRFREHCKIVVR
jgi:hypothetical protein